MINTCRQWFSAQAIQAADVVRISTPSFCSALTGTGLVFKRQGGFDTPNHRLKLPARSLREAALRVPGYIEGSSGTATGKHLCLAVSGSNKNEIIDMAFRFSFLVWNVRNTQHYISPDHCVTQNIEIKPVLLSIGFLKIKLQAYSHTQTTL